MKVVSIGGGTGQSLLLTALKDRDLEIVAIATTLDSGRSSGTLRDELGMIAPGDLRNCMIALAESDEWLKSVLQYRFEGVMPGMNLGNLLFAAIHEMGLDFDDALEEVARLLKMRGRAYPATLDPVHLRAELADGTTIEREDRIVGTVHAPIVSIGLTEPARAYPKAAAAIRDADLIVVGPGALYTSIVPHFLIPGIREAFLESRALKAYVPNLAEQANVTAGYRIADHLDALERLLGPGSFDVAIVNTAEAPADVARRYEEAGSPPIVPTGDELAELSARVRVVSGDYLSSTIDEEWNKRLYMRHDPDKLADAVVSLVHKPLRGLVLAAGRGTRMAPFSASTPKVLLDVYGKPLVAYRVEELLDAGIDDIVVVCSEETCGPMQAELPARYPAARFSFVVQRDAKGPAHAIECAAGLIRGSRVAIVLGDNLTDRPIIPNLVRAASAPGALGAIAARRVDNPSEFGVAELDGARVVGIVEKPRDPPSDLAVMGSAVLDADVLLELIAERGYTSRTPDGEREISAPQYFTDAGHALEVSVSKARILDVGRPYDLVAAARLIAERDGGQVLGYVAHSARIDPQAYIGPRAVVDSGATIEGACHVDGYVGKDARIVDSVLMDGSRVGTGALVERSVIGRLATVLAGVSIEAEEADVIVKGKRMRPGRVGMFVGEARVVERSEPGRIV